MLRPVFRPSLVIPIKKTYKERYSIFVKCKFLCKVFGIEVSENNLIKEQKV